MDLAASYNNLGTVYRNTGEFAKAKEYYERALEIRKEQLGPNHVKVAASYNNLGVVCRSMGYLEKSKEYHRQAVDIRNQILGPNHADLAGYYNEFHKVTDSDSCKSLCIII